MTSAEWLAEREAEEDSSNSYEALYTTSHLREAMVVALESAAKLPLDYPPTHLSEAGTAAHLRDGIRALIAELKGQP